MYLTNYCRGLKADAADPQGRIVEGRSSSSAVTCRCSKITKSKVPEALGDGRVGRLGSSWERSWGVSGGEVVAGALKNRALDYA